MDSRLDPSKSIPPGGSLVTITLADIPGGTRLELRHDVADAKTRDEHVRGWRYQLAVLARIVADDAFSPAPIDAWFAAWNEPSADRRRELLTDTVTPDVGFRDANGYTSGLDELLDHLAAVMQFMPGVRLEARGAPRHAHATVLADWAAVAGDRELMTGTNVFRLADERIADVVGVPTASR